MQTTNHAIKLAKIARSIAALATLALAAGCSVTPNQEVLDSTYPPPDQAQIWYADNQYASGTTITLAKTYADKGDSESVVIRNSSASSDIVINSVTSSDPARFPVTGFYEDTTLAPTDSTGLYVAFSDTAAETSTATLDVAYTASGKTRHISLTLKCTRVIDNAAPIIAVYDADGTTMVSGDTQAYDFGYAETAVAIEKTFTVKNVGQKTLTLGDIISSNEGDFAISTNPQGKAIAPGGSEILKIKRLDGTKAATATLSVISNASNNASFKLKLSSKDRQNGILKVYDFESVEVPATGYLDLGYVSSGTLSRTFTIKNEGAGNLTLVTIVSGNEDAISVADAPAEGMVLAGNTSTTFTLVQSDRAASASAKITITTGDGSKTFYVAGGNASINMSFANSFAYKLTMRGYDFGGVTASTEKEITLTNNGKAPIVIKSGALTGSSAYSDKTTYPLTIAAGGTGNLTLSYTPEGNWDEAHLVLADKFGRAYDLYVTGSGFAQPSSLNRTPTLWLRADRIDAADTLIVGSTVTVNAWKDSSGNGNNAGSVSGLNPAYNPNGINGRPSLTWSGTANKECMVVGTSTEKFLTTSTGTTTFVAFKTSSIEASRYVLTAYYGSSYVYPTLGWGGWYLDTDDGFYTATGSESSANRRLQYKFNVLGYTAAGSIARSPVDSLAKQVQANTTYAFCMYYNQSVVSPAANVSMVINNKQKDLTFFYASGTNITSATYPTYGSYGLRVDDPSKPGIVNPLTKSNDWARSAACSSYYLQNRIATGSTGYNNNIYLLYIGSASGAAAPFQGEISEIIMYNEPLEPGEIGSINNYLCNKYGAIIETD